MQRARWQSSVLPPGASKYAVVGAILGEGANANRAGARRLLDIGCRDCVLRGHVQAVASYEGLDLVQNAAGTVHHVMDASNGLPFADRAFDYVVALDFLEHVDDLQGTLLELSRISSRRLIVVLPNMAHALLRIRFLGSGRLGAKYDLVYGQGPDRHRWLTVLEQADAYMQRFASEHQLDLDTIWLAEGARKGRLARWGTRLGLSPQLLAWASLYSFTRRDATAAAAGA